MVDSLIYCLSKVNKDGQLCVYHPVNVLLPTIGAVFWIVHDELQGLAKQALIDLAEFALHDWGGGSFQPRQQV
jgi:hypothetical protein